MCATAAPLRPPPLEGRITGCMSLSRTVAAVREQGLRLLKGVGFLDDSPAQLAAFVRQACVAPSRLPSVTLCYALTPMRFEGLSSDDAWHAALPFMDAYLAGFDLAGLSITMVRAAVTV